MAHADAREEKWRGNWRMQWVASTLHTTSEYGVSSFNASDAQTSAASSRLNWRPTGRIKWTGPFRAKDEIWFLRVCRHISTVEQKRKVMTHAQKPDLVFQRNGRVHLYRRGCQFCRLLAAEVCASAVVMLDRPCPIQCTTAGYPLHSPFSPSLLHPCVSVCHHIPFLLYLSLELLLVFTWLTLVMLPAFCTLTIRIL